MYFVKGGFMVWSLATRGRREQAKEDKRRRIVSAAAALFAEHGLGGVTTQQIADRADVAIGTLYLYAATKAELLIMVQNQKFATAIDDSLAAASSAEQTEVGAVQGVLALLEPLVSCLREHPVNGRADLHELVFGDPVEPHRAAGLQLAHRLEDGLTRMMASHGGIGAADASVLARVVTAIVHVTSTPTAHLHDTLPQVPGHIRLQVAAVLPQRQLAARPSVR